ncbi:unnamed protein product [Rotaria magnacalcarata]|uniref:Uncharacterized protein n=2 Tax=Rotaria magnacalcarata TaxID=392030 RepID=A0A8S3D0D7_9BILA|nr:unnamed protein product [Rotaria magnacalcarata]
MNHQGTSSIMTLKSDEFFDDYDTSCHPSQFSNVSATDILVNNMKRQFCQLNLNENESDKTNLLFDQYIHHYQNIFQNIICKCVSTVSGNQAPYHSCLSPNLIFNNNTDLARYFTILNYLKDFNIYTNTRMNMQQKVLQNLKYLPKFESMASRKIYYINRTTTWDTITKLIKLAKETNIFVMEIKYGYKDTYPALIQILSPYKMQFFVVFVETKHLP